LSVYLVAISDSQCVISIYTIAVLIFWQFSGGGNICHQHTNWLSVCDFG